MREFIKTLEFIGKLKIDDDFEKDNVRCIYKDDVYSNKVMKGDFDVDYLSADFLNKFGGWHKFVFNDESGREIKGTITGFNLKHEYNDRKYFLHFFADEYIQMLKERNENPPVTMRARFNIPFISYFTREISFSHGFHDDYIFKFVSPKFILDLDIGNIIIDDFVYIHEYKEPDSIFTHDLNFEITKEILNFEDGIRKINDLSNFIDNINILFSFLFNHRFSSFRYYVQFMDKNGKWTHTIDFKESHKLIGDEYFEDKSDYQFREFFTDTNSSLLINKYLSLASDVREKIKRLLFSFLTIKEVKILEPSFLTAYFTLEAISKFIINPRNLIKPEKLIKDAISFKGIALPDFKISHNRLINSNSDLEWEITEYRNYLTHFNEDFEFNKLEIHNECKKIISLTRKLILSCIEPSLADWPLPE